MKYMPRGRRLAVILSMSLCCAGLGGCVVVSVASTAVSVASTAVSVGVSAGSAVVGGTVTVAKTVTGMGDSSE